VRSHLAGVNARGKSATRIAITIAERAAQNKTPVSQEIFDLPQQQATDAFVLGLRYSPMPDAIQFTRIDGSWVSANRLGGRQRPKS
jgi:hypothetical protein